MVVRNFYFILFVMLITAYASVAKAVEESILDGLTGEEDETPPTFYTGFERLLDDETTLVVEELLDLDDGISRVALYHNGDRLHRQIPKQVHLMIENKLMKRLLESGRFEIIQCIECRTTRVHME